METLVHARGPEPSTATQALFIAEAFGFGPSSKLLILARRLLQHQPMGTTFLGDGCAHELCKDGPFDAVVRADPTDLRRGGALYRQLAAADVLVSAMEFSPMGLASEMGLTTVLFDSLLWLWPSLPCRAGAIDWYVCQNFLGVKERAAALHRGQRFLVVPPLTMAEDGEWESGDTVVLNFGGMDNPYAAAGPVLAYAANMLEAVLAECQALSLELQVCGRDWVLQRLRSRFRADSLRFDTLSPEAFTGRLRQARCLITSPGLETIYEAFTMGVPAYLLPPQNNSQAYQAQRIQAEVPGLSGLQWHELRPTDVLDRDLAPADLTRRLLGFAGELGSDPGAAGTLRGSIHEFLEKDAAAHARQCRHQFGFIERMRAGADLQISDLPSIASLVRKPSRSR